MKIWKYVLSFVGDYAEVTMPNGAQVVSVLATASKDIVAYALVLPEEKTLVKVRFRLAGTGHQLDGGAFTYRATIPDGPFVWHILELAQRESV